MSFVSYYTRVAVQFVIFVVTKIFILRGRRASPRIAFTRASHIIVANHRSGLDPFVIVSSLRFRDFFRLAPFSFMTANKFMKPVWLRPLAWSAGCFPAHPGLGNYGIDKAVEDLKAGYTLVIFPEGRRVLGTPIEPKKGIEEIMRRSPESRLVLTHIEWHSQSIVRFIHMRYPLGHDTPKTASGIMDDIFLI